MAILFQIGKMPVMLSRVRVCPRCGNGRTKKSQRLSLRLQVLRLLGLDMFRCLECWERYIGLRWSRLSSAARRGSSSCLMTDEEFSKRPIPFRRSKVSDAGGHKSAPWAQMWQLESDTIGASFIGAGKAESHVNLPSRARPGSVRVVSPQQRAVPAASNQPSASAGKDWTTYTEN
jgi:hypothetical protein